MPKNIPRIGASRATMAAARAGIPLGPHGGILVHPYQRDPQSGAGNCVCGRHDKHPLHDPLHTKEADGHLR